MASRAGTCPPRARVVTRHDLAHAGTALRTRGLTTTSAGGFFFLPSLLHLGAHDLAATLGPPKHEGLPKEPLALGLVFASLFGSTAGLRTVETVSRAAFGLRAGLPFLPAPSTQSRCLQAVPVKDALACQTALGRRLVARGQGTPGHPGTRDGHTRKRDARKAMHHAFITQEDRSGKAIRTFSTQDQASKTPLMALAAYSGTPVSQVPHRVADLTRDILGRDVLMVADNEWYGGPLLQERHAQDGVAVLPPVTSSPTRLEECDPVPLEPYDQTIWGHVAAVSTTMTACDGPLRRLWKQRRKGTDVALSTPAHALTAATALPTDPKRWRRENLFAENACLGVHHRPSLPLNALQTMFSLRLLAFQVMDNCRHDLGLA
jgi:hypothetical protein